MAIWEIQHHITSQHKKRYKKQNPYIRTAHNSTITLHNHTQDRQSYFVALSRSKQFLEYYISTGQITGWGFIRFKKNSFFL